MIAIAIRPQTTPRNGGTHFGKCLCFFSDSTGAFGGFGVFGVLDVYGYHCCILLGYFVFQCFSNSGLDQPLAG